MIISVTGVSIVTKRHCLLTVVPLTFSQAIWYTENQGLDGPVFGSADMWNGVGIFFDSFDNDGKVYLLLKLLAIFHVKVFLAVRLLEGGLPDTLNLIVKNLADSLSMVVSFSNRDKLLEAL